LRRYKISVCKHDPPNSIRVAGPSRWSNPFKVDDYGREQAVGLYREWLVEKLDRDPQFLDLLKDKNLGCYCELDELCHCDVLLEFLEKA